MTRFRWSLGAALTLLSLVAAAKALATYAGHGLFLGSAAVVILGAIALVGFGSLARARLRLARELSAIAAEPPTGELYLGRRRRLEAHRAAGGTADGAALAALGQASAAEETGRAYLGRYLVAVTVLVGLVGTFAGLMETLRGVAPLVGDGEAATLQLIAAPLAGLDVTFGASIVGILVTLALALVQGDLVLAEELALARLEERTALTIVPSLWPPAESPSERAARELSGLRGELTSFVGRTVLETSARVGEVAATQVERLVRELKHLLGDSARASAVEVREGLRGVSDEATAQLRALVAAETAELARLRETTTAQTAAMASALSGAARDTAETQRRILDGAALQSASMAASLEAAARHTAASQQKLLDGAALQSASMAASLEAAAHHTAASQQKLLDGAAAQAASLARSSGEAIARNEAALASLAERHAARLDDTAQAIVGAIDRSIGAHAARLDGIAAAVDKAAKAATAGGAALQHATAEQSGLLQHAVAESASRAAAAVGVSAARTGAQLAEVGAHQAARIEQLTQSLLAALEQAGAAQAARLDAIAVTVEKSARAAAQARDELQAADRVRATVLGAAMEKAAAHTAAELGALSRAHAEKLDQTTQALLVAVHGSVGESGVRLDRAAATLLRAADGLRDGATALAPHVATLGPELASLSHELALLAARADASHDPATLLDELQRLGDGVDRLEGLVRLGQSS